MNNFFKKIKCFFVGHHFSAPVWHSETLWTGEPAARVLTKKCKRCLEIKTLIWDDENG